MTLDKIYISVRIIMLFDLFISSLAFTGKLNPERFSGSLTLNWSSAVYLKLTTGKRFNLACAGLLRLYLLCDVRYFCHVKEDTALALVEFYKYKNVPV